MFKKMYPVIEVSKSKVIMYKAVHKNRDGVYFSDYKNDFIYTIGETKTEVIDNQDVNSCSGGIHVSHKMFAILFGKNWNDMALLECEVNPKNIIVSKDCDGKVRASEIRVIREVPKIEW